MSRYIVRRSNRPGWWVVEDVENSITLRFEEGRFNETQEVTVGYPSMTAQRLAGLMSEMGGYMVRNHSDIVFPVHVFEWKIDGDGNRYLQRNKPPRFIVVVEEEHFDLQQLGDAVRKAGEFIKKGGRNG